VGLIISNLEIEEKIKDHENRLQALEQTYKNNTAPGNKKMSIKEFMLSKNPTGAVQKALLAGYYLESFEKIESFNIADIDGCFRNAKEKLPKNLNATINKNIAKGHMMPAKQKKNKKSAWTLTSTGERFVENDFKKE